MGRFLTMTTGIFFDTLNMRVPFDCANFLFTAMNPATGSHPRIALAVAIRLILFLLVALPKADLFAQTEDPCFNLQGQTFLEIGDVRARIFNNGALFSRGGQNYYEVPKGGPAQAIYNTSLLFAGSVDGEIRAAGGRQTRQEFWPGPLNTTDCSEYDRLWTIHQSDIESYNRTGTPNEALSAWPWQLGAPVIDADGNPDNYDLAAGDRPELLGQQTIWWVMNDGAREHEISGSPPLELEVHGTAFAFDLPKPILPTTTFYRYKVINKSQKPIDDAYIGLFIDADLGNFDDDYIGSDSLLHLAYIYNADNFDEGYDAAYGDTPPAIGYTFLRTAPAHTDGRDNDRDGTIDEVGEQLGMTSVACSGKNEQYAVSESAVEFHNCLQGLWTDGQPMRSGDYGRNETGDIVKFYYPGDPTVGAFWSALNQDGAGNHEPPQDQQFRVGSGPFDMAPNDTLEFVFAIVFSRGENHLDSVKRLKNDVSVILDAGDSVLEPTFIETPSSPIPPPSAIVGFDQNFPNPFSITTTIRYSLPDNLPVRLAVYDVLGREVELLVDEMQEAGVYTVEFKANDLPAGLYMARLEMGFLRFTKKMILSR